MSRKVITLGYLVNPEEDTIRRVYDTLQEFIDDGALSEHGISQHPIESDIRLITVDVDTAFLTPKRLNVALDSYYTGPCFTSPVCIFRIERGFDKDLPNDILLMDQPYYASHPHVAKKKEGWSIPFAVAAGMGMDQIGG